MVMASFTERFEIELPDEVEQIRLGRQLGEALRWHGQVWLRGEMGAGKTTLTRGILRGAGYEGAVKSPTYTLLEPYEVNGHVINHFDLYRLGDPEELAFIGARELLATGQLTIIEWPERGADQLPTPDLIVDLALSDANPGRSAVLTVHSSQGATALMRLVTAIRQPGVLS